MYETPRDFGRSRPKREASARADREPEVELFGSSLRRIYEKTLTEPVGDEFKDLLDKLK